MAMAALRELTVFFWGGGGWGLGLKLPNNSIRFKVGYDETTGLYFMSGGTKIGYKFGELPRLL